MWSRAPTAGGGVALVLLAATGCGSGGPLIVPRPDAMRLGRPAKVGAVVSFGLLVVYNNGPTITLDRADVVEAPPGLRRLGALAARPEAMLQAAADGFPPRTLRDGRPVAGFRIQHDGGKGFGTELIFGFKVERPGRWTVRHFRISYHDDSGHHYVKTITSTLTLCAPHGRRCAPQ
jgi:hypothetical protein